jgi:hypothetical protein
VNAALDAQHLAVADCDRGFSTGYDRRTCSRAWTTTRRRRGARS